MMDYQDSILVSVCCMTYNHEHFIEKCLTGFVSQKTNFAFEILVHEDASTDGTSEIVKIFETNHPKLFRVIYQKENVFSTGKNNLTGMLFPMSKGKYIALCEGDDYWTDPLKLQKQVDFLEGNEDYAIHYHHCNTLKNDYLVDNDANRRIRNFSFNFDNTVYRKNGYTLSMIFRKSLLNYSEFINICNFSWVGDWQLELYLMSKGNQGYYSIETMGVYRDHDGGIINSHFKKLNSVDHSLHRITILLKYLSFVSIRSFKMSLRHRIFIQAEIIVINGNLYQSLKYFILMLRIYFVIPVYLYHEKKVPLKIVPRAFYYLLKKIF